MELQKTHEQQRGMKFYTPSETDMVFLVTDAKYERRFIPNVEFIPIPSIWGTSRGRDLVRELPSHISRLVGGGSVCGTGAGPSSGLVG